MYAPGCSADADTGLLKCMEVCKPANWDGDMMHEDGDMMHEDGD